MRVVVVIHFCFCFGEGSLTHMLMVMGGLVHMFVLNMVSFVGLFCKRDLSL